MKTLLTESPFEAARFTRRGGVVAFPTETVFGLGANVFDAAAVGKIFAAKRRPADNPLIAHIYSIEQIPALVSRLTPSAERFIAAFFPAPLTLVLPKSERVPPIATANLASIGVRMPAHELALEFLREAGEPLVAPSANLSGKPSPTTWQAVFQDLDGRIDCILKGAQTNVGLESTVVDCAGDAPRILRVGAVTLEDLQKIVPETQLYQSSNSENLPSPGLKHRHYSPLAKVVLINPRIQIRNPASSAFIGLNAPDADFRLEKICRSTTDYAHEVFEFFRECDRQNVETIYCQIVAENDLGLALMDRLKRAAAK